VSAKAAGPSAEGRLRALPSETAIDHAAAERAVRDLLAARRVDAERLRDTPRRVAQAYADSDTAALLPTTFPNDEHYDELVVAATSLPLAVRAPMLPFHGVAHLAYLPQDRILGLSSWAGSSSSTHATCAIPERLTTQIAGGCSASWHRGLGCDQAEHLCMACRVQARRSHRHLGPPRLVATMPAPARSSGAGGAPRPETKETRCLQPEIRDRRSRPGRSQAAETLRERGSTSLV
jgi:GTP cyclohydrolase I